MNRKLVFIFIILMIPVHECLAWGFWAHKRINYLACFTLPEPLFGFFRKHIEYLSEHAVDADKRRHSDVNEAPRHYIDLDKYGANPLDSVPRVWQLAVQKYSEDTLMAHGIVPWHILKVYRNLSHAFYEKNKKMILYYAANLGHYIGDAHVPLHCTENYNGQLTNQHGIHGLWESRLPELYGSDYDMLSGSAVYIPNVSDLIWERIAESFQAVDSVLRFEKLLSDTFPSDLKYTFEARGIVTQRVYSREFSDAFHNLLNGQVERRMLSSVFTVGSFWYSAWVEAGSPDLEGMSSDLLTNEEIIESAGDSIKVKGRLCEH
ncbi:MAG: S1/P1 Nuclease [Bacteroidetes bacterium]|nr:MAG: S1/P1 Nuclease [Bacteroidota bacterium]REK07001.1 MAG: S1/P1 Nuclease [Bacteroidota bacterium]REK33652.1 MAG: S1/P1 Nuclease [Bacteroidota bacterium]REK48638.1 MAG: S1/P1 Nuclease [Bacteroidota bacterium]